MPATYLGRVVFWLFCFSCVILYTSYTALLTSYLTVSTKTPPFTTFNAAVASHPTWQIGIMRGTPLLQFLMEAKGGDYAVLSTRLKDHPHLTVSTEEEGVARLLTENYAFLTTNQLMTYMYRKNCSVKQIDINLFPSYGHMGYAKNLPFAGILDMEISRLTDGGVLDRLERRWWGRKIPCEDPEPFTHLDFTHTVTAFLILLIGFILASFFLIIEKVYKKCLRNRKKFFVTPEQPKAPHSKKQQYGATQSANTIPSSARSRILTPLDPLPHFSENEVENYCKPPHIRK
ncbi:glutamate receptor ionotropic, kainate 2-like [Homarus americanus]|nr:glutamate receptor ionotropic, kainate 2-like [Homarus americanus]